MTADNKAGVNCDPSVDLEVFNTSGQAEVLIHSNSDNARLTLDATSNKDAQILFEEAGTQRWIIQHKADASDRLQILDNGGDHGVYLDVDAGSWSSYSDERMKSELSELTNATENLNTLQCVNYKWSHRKNKKHLGLIAQEVYKVYPEVVSGDPNEEYSYDSEKKEHINAMGVRYTELVPVLIKAVQELSARIEALENK